MQKLKIFPNLELIYSQYKDKFVTDKASFLKKIRDDYQLNLKKNLYFYHPHQAGRLIDFQKNKLPQGDQEIDAIISNRSQCFFYMNVADCFPVVLFDIQKKVFALIHAGWKPLSKHILQLSVQDMIAKYHCQVKNIKTWIGPGIQKCCYQFNNQTAHWQLNKIHPEIIKEIKNNHQKKWQIDLEKFINLELIAAGLSKTNIKSLQQCTCCQKINNQAQYWSHRRFCLGKENKNGRNFIGIRLVL